MNDNSQRFKNEKNKLDIKNDRRVHRFKLIDNYRVKNSIDEKNLTSNSNRNLNLNCTYAIKNESSDLKRHKLLEIWKKERQEKYFKSKNNNKPIFKVKHFDSKEYDISKFNSNLTSTKKNNEIKKKFIKFNSQTNVHQTKADCDFEQKDQTQKYIHHFGNSIHECHSKFTFSASLDNLCNNNFTDRKSFDKKQNEEKMKTIDLKDSISNLEISEKNSIKPKQIESNNTFVETPNSPNIKFSKESLITQTEFLITQTEFDINEDSIYNEIKINSILNKENNFLKKVNEIANKSIDICCVDKTVNRETQIDSILNLHNSIVLKENNKINIEYYRQLVEEKTKLLIDLASNWETICENENKQIPDVIQGDIRCACGLARLLIDERFTQFYDLITQSENYSALYNTDLKEVKLSDLDGFWDMINYQIINIEKKFERLNNLKSNNYIEINEIDKVKKKITKSLNKVYNPQAKDTKEKDTKEKDTKEKDKKVKSRFAEFREKIRKINNENDQNLINNDINIVTIKSNIQVQTTEKVKLIHSENGTIDLISLKSPFKEFKHSNSTNNDKISFDFDFDDFKPITWKDKSNRCKDQKHQKCDLNDSLGNNSIKIKDNTPKTPKSEDSVSKSNQLKNLTNSPLLKLALISSHGKRQSINLKNL